MIRSARGGAMEARAPVLAGAAAALFYLCWPSSFYNFDGVACAIAVELGDFRHLAHGNHLAYGVMGWAFDRFWRLLGYSGPAIVCLQTLDSLLGGATVGVFYAWLKSLKLPSALVFGASSCLAVSYAFWFWSLEAQVYALGALFLALTAREAWSESPRPARLGFLHAAAVLGHVGHAMFAPAALLLLRRRKRRDTARYLLALAGGTLAAYALAGALLVRPASIDECRVWLLGSAALSDDKSFLWHGGYSWPGLVSWLKMSLRIFCDPIEGAAPGWTARLFGAAALALAALGLLARPASGRPAAAWLACYCLLFLAWEPFTIVYRMTDLLAVWLLAALGLASRPRAGAALLAAWALGAGLLNARWSVGPRADPARNEAYQQALWLGARIPENGWVAATSVDQVYLPYFAHRKALSMRYIKDRETLRARLASIRAAGESLFVTSDVLAGPQGSLFSGLRLREAGRRGETAAFEVLGGGS